MRKYRLILLSFIITLNLSAQDFQFSQMEINTFVNNPAANGLSGNAQQIYLTYRAENTKNTAFRNMLLAYEHRVNHFTIGAKILQNDAGSASLKSSKVLLDLSYKKVLNEKGDNLSLGFSGGIIQRMFDPMSFEFESQYREGQGFDEFMASGEQFVEATSLSPSLSAGLVYTKRFDRFEANFGIALNNLNRPKSSFLESMVTRYPTQYSLFGKVNLPWKEKLNGDLYFIFNQLSGMQERVAGIVINKNISGTTWLHFGIANRFRQTLLMQAGLSFKQAKVILNYDFNQQNRTGSQSIFEISGTYNFKKVTISSHRNFR